MYKYEVVLRETRMKKVTLMSSRDLNRDQIKACVTRDDVQEDLSVVDKVELLNIEKSENDYVAPL